MLQIRQGVFETNSSSTHAVSVVRYDASCCEIPESIHFGTSGEFGWDNERYFDIASKANYLWIAVCDEFNRLEDEDELLRIKAAFVKILNDYGVKHVTFDEEDYKEHQLWDGEPYLEIDGYIDHSNELYGWAQQMIDDPELLIGYLFHPHSYVHTGNDNEDTDITWAEDAELDIYKGN